jgi:hypothetical protein
MSKAHTRKRPCRICRKWFEADPRQIGRQKTCNDPACRKENHRRQCEQWNRKNREYFKANYLSAKLARTKDPPAAAQNKTFFVKSSSRIKLYLPRDVVAGIIGAQHLVILEYIIEQMIRRAKGRSSAARAP